MSKPPMLQFDGVMDEGDGLILHLTGGDFSLTVALPYKKTRQLFLEWFKAIQPAKRNEILLSHIQKELGPEDHGTEEDKD